MPIYTSQASSMEHCQIENYSRQVQLKMINIYTLEVQEVVEIGPCLLTVKFGVTYIYIQSHNVYVYACMLVV